MTHHAHHHPTIPIPQQLKSRLIFVREDREDKELLAATGGSSGGGGGYGGRARGHGGEPSPKAGRGGPHPGAVHHQYHHGGGSAVLVGRKVFVTGLARSTTWQVGFCVCILSTMHPPTHTSYTHTAYTHTSYTCIIHTHITHPHHPPTHQALKDHFRPAGSVVHAVVLQVCMPCVLFDGYPCIVSICIMQET